MLIRDELQIYVRDYIQKEPSQETRFLLYFRIPALSYIPLPWQFLYFLPDPQGQGSLRPTLGWAFMG